MTNEEIKISLQKIWECKNDFSVIQTGKKSSRVNGFYRPATKEIFLHNKNFSSDNQMMYTAIHELTHHILISEKNVASVKSHTTLFWSTFYDLMDIAVEKGIYRRKRSGATKELVGQARKIQKEIIEAQKRLGELLGKINESCKSNGERYEDVVESDLQLSRSKAQELRSMSASQCEYSDEISKVIETVKDVVSAKKAAENGKTLAQIKAIASKKPALASDDDLDDPSSLKREKKRLERTIERLQDRLVQVEESLASIQGE